MPDVFQSEVRFVCARFMRLRLRAALKGLAASCWTVWEPAQKRCAWWREDADWRLEPSELTQPTAVGEAEGQDLLPDSLVVLPDDKEVLVK